MSNDQDYTSDPLPRVPYFTLERAAEAYSIPISDLRRALKDGSLKMVRVTVPDYRLTGPAIEAWLHARPQRVTAPEEGAR